MKKVTKYCLLLLLCIVLTACDVDPYKNQRPIDYEDSIWVSKGENYEMLFEAGKMADSKLIVNDEKLCSFYLLFSSLDNSVIVYKFNSNNEYTSEDLLFKGSCDFGKNRFIISIDERHNIPDEIPNELTFEREK